MGDYDCVDWQLSYTAILYVEHCCRKPFLCVVLAVQKDS